MPRIAVLGSNGWLGSALLSRLLDEEGTDVVTPSRDQLERAAPADLRDILRPDRDLTVVNCVGVIRGTDEAVTAANLTFVEILVEALASTEAYLLQLGSAAEYGDPASPRPIMEASGARPVSTYGRSKAAASRLVGRRDDWCVMRPFNGIDAEMTAINPLREIRDKVRAALAISGDVELWSADTTRDHVSRGFITESLRLATRERPSGVFNVCSGVGLTYREITEAMIDVAGGRLPIRDLAQESGIPAVVGDPSAWREASGLSEALDARQVARLVMS